MTVSKTTLREQTIDFHRKFPAGKVKTVLSKPLRNQKDLSLAYTPGVAIPCLEIQNDPSLIFEYTGKGNCVAVITNGTAVLGLGDIGPAASKPVMEGKCALLKRFADLDAIDLEVNTKDPDEFVNIVKHLSLSWGGINLEDIKAPECFQIEEQLKQTVDIPVFHDDQHGTAVIVAAGLINAIDLSGKKLSEVRLVINGAGAAAIACLDLLVTMGLNKDNILVCDSRGVIYKGRKENMNKWKEKYASHTNKRDLAEALKGADTFIGLSVKGALTSKMVSSMAPNPVIFALANPDPEITPNEVEEVRSDAIVATGRSDYSNQINNVMGFPYIFRGALDVRSKTINNAMKIAAVHAIAGLAKKDPTEEIALAYTENKFQYGKEYIIPVPFDSRLMTEVSSAVAKAAMESGAALKKIEDFELYKKSLLDRLKGE